MTPCFCKSWPSLTSPGQLGARMSSGRFQEAPSDTCSSWSRSGEVLTRLTVFSRNTPSLSPVLPLSQQPPQWPHRCSRLLSLVEGVAFGFSQIWAQRPALPPSSSVILGKSLSSLGYSLLIWNWNLCSYSQVVRMKWAHFCEAQTRSWQ